MKKKLLLSQLVFQLFFLLFISSVYGHGESLRKTPTLTNTQKKKKTPPILSTELKDRFGNTYTFDEIMLPELSSTPTGGSSGSSNANAIPTPPNYNTVTCNAGIFKLYFVDETNPAFGFGNVIYRNVICEVFSDLSRLLHNVSGSSTPFVKVLIASDSSIRLFNKGVALSTGTDIAGTSFYPSKRYQSHAWVDNVMYSTIKKGSSTYNLMNGSQQTNLSYSLAMHGLLVVNFTGKTWYTNFNDTASIPANVEDLYSHTLHQAMHMLGIASLIDSVGNSSLGNKLYARFDNYLYKSTTSSKLLSYSTTTRKITASTLSFGCSSPNNTLFNGVSAGTLSIYNDNPWNKGINFSHFGCSGTGVCNSTYAKPTNPMVMVPCLGAGTTYLKRHPSQAEVYALCDLGYKLRNVGGVYAYGNNPSNNASQGNVYQTYSSCTEPCIAIGGHDTILMDTIQQVCVRSFATSLLGNDLPSSSVITRLELLDTMKGTLTYTSTGFTFTPKPFFTYGDVNLVYYPQCSAGAELGSPTFITIKYPYPPLPPCQPNNQCNYVCNGTFEETDQPFQWSNFNLVDNQWYPNTPDLYRYDFGSTCVSNWIFPEWSGCDEPNGCSSDYNNTLNNQPHPAGGNQFIGIWATNFGYFEAFNLPLRKPLYHDSTKHYRMRLLAKTDAFADCNNPIFYVLADDTVPRMIPDGIRTYPKLNCNQFCDTVGLDTITSSTWTYYNFPIAQPAKGDSFTHIIITSQISISGGGETPPAEYYYAYFDNIEIYDSTAPKVIISSNPNDIMPCTDTGNTIKYTICLDNSLATNTDSIVVHIDLPYGFSVASGSDFNSSGNYTIPAGAISGTVCDTLLLKYQMNFSQLGYNKGYDIKASYSTNMFCTELTSNVVKIYPQNNAVVITKTVSNTNPNIGDTIIYNIEVCNQSSVKITDLQLVDTIPDGLIPDITTQFNVNGNILTKTVTLDSANLSGWTCLSYFYSVVVTSNCRIQNTAYMQSPANPCFKGKSSVTLHPSSGSSPVKASIRPQTVAWCGTNVPLSALIQNPIGSYTYQWQRNGVNITGATSANYTATISGTYGVQIAQGGCSSIIPSVTFDTGFRVTTSFKRPNCTANNGFISILPQNGVPPYTYTWASSSSTAATRLNLGAGTYTVTVTDSIGCARVITTTLNAIVDTLAMTRSLTHTQCNLPNGSIQLTASKGTPPYQFLWNDGNTQSLRTGLIAGIYTVILTDQFGCQLFDTITLTNTTATINFNDSVVRPVCTSTTGTVKIKPSGGTAPYTYLWNDGNTAQLRTGLSPATYYITVTDNVGCKGYDTVKLLGVVDTLKIKDSIIQPICTSLNGEIHLQPLNGSAPYTYLWNNGITTNPLVGYTDGNYQVTVTDINGCSVVNNYTLTHIDYSLTSVDSVHHINCNTTTGSIFIDIQGGTEPYSLWWNDGDTARYRTGLNDGLYTAYIFDYYGCSLLKNYTITSNTTQITIKDSVIPPTNCTTSNGKIYLNVQGGIKPYTYYWNTGSTSKDLLGNSIGSYAVTVTDIDGCTASAQINIPSPSNLKGFVHTLSNCVSNSVKLYFVNISNTPITSYYWKDMTSNIYLSSTSTATGTDISHVYRLVVTESNGCQTIYNVVPNPNNYLLLGSAYGPKKSNLDSAIANGYIQRKDSMLRIKIGGTFTVNSSWQIQYSDIVLDNGANILVQSSNCGTNSPIVTMNKNNIYTCGNQLAKGIEVNCANTEFNFNENQIRDCYKAIEISQSIQTKITYNLFENDLIGIHIIGTANNPITIVNTNNMEGNTFQNSAYTSLSGNFVKPNYTGMLKDSRSHPLFQFPSRTGYTCPWAGIIVENCPNIAIGQVGKPKLSFKSMNFGVMHNGGTLSLNSTQFDFMREYNNAFISGICVFLAENTNLKSTVSINGFGFLAQEYFANSAGTGVYQYGNMTTTITNCRMIGMNQGVILSEINGSVYPNVFNASNNNIGANIIGFNINNYINDFKCTITNNRIVPGSITPYNPSGIRIVNDNIALNRASVNVSNNTILSENKLRNGIHIQGFPKTTPKNGVYVTNNVISITSPQMTEAGISYYLTSNVFHEKNTINATNRSSFNPTLSPRIYPVGVNYETSDGVFKCDSIQNIRTGARFMGGCTNSDWQRNKLNNHTYGLRIETGSTLKDQNKAGNSFAGTCDSEAISWQVRPTNFYFANTNPIYLPNPCFPSNTNPLTRWWNQLFIPSTLWESNSCSSILLPNGSGLKSIGSYGDMMAVIPSVGYQPIDRNSQPMTDILLSDIDTSVLMNTMTFGLFEPELLWQYRLDLYNKLKPREIDYRDTSVFRDYITQIEDGSINEFSQIQEIERVHTDNTLELGMQMDLIQSRIDSAWDRIRLLDSAYYDTTDLSVRASIHSLREGVYAYIYSQDTLLHSLRDDREATYSNHLAEMRAMSDSLLPEGVSDSLMQRFYNMYYQTYGAGQVTMSSAQYQIYESLAQHCPYENFEAVYRSRGIVMIHNDSIAYNDSILCAQVGITLKNTKPIVYDKVVSKPLQFSVYPNPTKEDIKLWISEIPKETLTFIVNDILGREVYFAVEDLKTNFKSIDTRQWNSGIYSLRLMSGKNKLYHTQIIVNK